MARIYLKEREREKEEKESSSFNLCSQLLFKDPLCPVLDLKLVHLAEITLFVMGRGKIQSPLSLHYYHT